MGIGEADRGSRVFVIASLKNHGTPAAVDPGSWSLTISTKDGNKYRGSPLTINDDGQDFCTLNTANALKFVREDGLDIRASKEIGRLGITEGVLIFSFGGMLCDKLFDSEATIRLEANDVSGQNFYQDQKISYLLERSATNATKFMPSFKHPYVMPSERCN